MKLCTVCQEPISDSRIKRWPFVRTCSSSCSKDWETIDSRERMRNKRLWYIYKMTNEEFQIKIDQQNDCCAICKEPFEHIPLEERNTQTKTKIMVDHNHNCCPKRFVQCGGKCVRGLLCQKCNVFISNIENGLLEQALIYLDYWNKLDIKIV